jgi:Ca2+-binding RTX toxin-like protein
LLGGTGVDTFQLQAGASLSGKINGAGGDWLDYSSRTTAVTVNLATGTATSVAGGVTHIQNVLGSTGNNKLAGDATGNILIGGAGANQIVGGSGRSLLIGGNGASTIVGGAADDILIAGNTTFDQAALMSILKEWQRTDALGTYALRLQHLETGVGGLNPPSVKLVPGATVLDTDQHATHLTGGNGLDWFFAKPGDDVVTDQNHGGAETVSPL